MIKMGLWAVPLASVLSACVESPKEEISQNSYVYTGEVSGSDIILDAIDTLKCFKTLTVLGARGETAPYDSIKSNTCEFETIVQSRTHQRPDLFVASHDTLEFIDKTFFKLTGHVLVDWPRPLLDSNWVREFTSEPNAYQQLEWGRNSLKIKAYAGTTQDSAKVPDSIKRSKLFSYVLRFDKKSVR